MSTTYHSLASGPLTQNWSSLGQITSNDSWAGVPSITGYLGDTDAASPTGVDPRTLTGAALGAIDVIANQSNPNTLTSGGVAEFEITDPTVALNGSGTADAPSLVLYLDASGRQDVRVQFNARDVDGSTDDAQQQVNVQYRIGSSGAWTNVPGGYLADATTVNAANQVTAIDVTLPAAANNQPQVEVRILSTNALGNDEWVGIDDINVSSATFTGGADVTAPTLTSSNPVDNATGIAASADIVLTFNEAVKAGTGDITVTDGAGDVRVITLGAIDPDGTVTINGTQVAIDLATNLASNKAYDVVVAAGAIKDAAGNNFAGIALDALDFTTAAAVPLTAIGAIQGAGHTSALVGNTVATQGVVTAIDSNGFYIQDATGDGNAATSDAIFVFTSGAPTVTLGHLVKVTGKVSEFTDPAAAPGSLSITQLTAPVIEGKGVGPAIVATQIGGSAGLKPPTSNLDDDGLTTFDPVNDGIDFFESLEGMLVTVKTPVAVSPTNSFGEIYTIVDNDDNPANGLNTNSPTERGGVGISGGATSFGNTNTVGGDFNPERIQIDDDSGIFAAASPLVSVGAKLSDVTGVVSYGFGNYEISPTQAYTVTAPSALTAEVTTLVGSAQRLTIGNYNVENLDPGDGAAKFNALAQQIVTNLKAPDILSLQEVQDNNGATNDTVISAATTLQMLVDAIKTASGGAVQYAFQDNPFIGDDLNGGEPGGNIRNAFLYRVDRGVDLIESSLRTIDANGAPTTAVGGNGAAGHPFNASRPPLVADFTFNGQIVTVIDNHFSSKGGSGALMGTQPPINGAEPARAAQAQAVNTFVDSLLATNLAAKVVVAGDLNEFEFEEPMQVLAGKATYLDGPDADSVPEFTAGGTAVLSSLSDMLPVNQRYDYVFDGSSQSLDQMYVTNAARAGAQYDIVHINAEFANQASDHDALVGSFDMSTPISTTPTGAIDIAVKGSLTLAGAEISAFDAASGRLFTTSNAGLQVVNLANPAAPSLIATVDFKTLGFATTDVTSVTVKDGIVAVALPAADKTQPGKVVFLKASDHTLLGSVAVGALPDMVTFTPDGKKVLVANEGEIDASGADAPGSVSIIDISGGVAAATVQTATFDSFNGQEAALRAAGVRIFDGKSVSMDVEPEYIAISPDGTTAMVTLQEANAVAILDIATATFTKIVPLGLKDWNGLQLDISDRDGAGGTASTKLVSDSHLFGMYMPDAIASYRAGGQTYYVMANEGDDRDDFLNPDETIRVSSSSYDLDNALFPNEAALKDQAALGRHTVSNSPGLRGDTDGDGDIDQILTYGGRSFSIVDQQGNRVFDSGDAIERIIVEKFPALFDDTRSDNKGAEPEGLTIGSVGGTTYAFVALERSNVTLAFDITNPANVTYAGAARNASDVSPEGLLFIPAAQSPSGKDLLVSSNEVSNNITVFELAAKAPAPAFTLQLLHLSDGEAGLLAGDTAPNLAALVDAFDGTYTNTLILSGGDNFLPGPFINAGTDPSLNAVAGIGATAAGRPDIAILNALGVETSTIGNHEFDMGSTAFRDAFTPSGAWGGALFPYLSSNLDFSGDSALNPRFTNTLDGGTGTLVAEASTLKGRIAPAAIVTEGGQKIGIVGATTQIIESISSPNGTEVKGFPTGPGANGEVDNMDLLAAQLQPIINELIAEGVNKIVLTSHLQQIQNEQLLATKLQGVDIILSAGSNTRLGDADDQAATFPGHEPTFANTYPIVTQGTDGKTTVIVNTDGEYTYLGRLVVDFDANGDIILGSLAANTAVNGAYASTAANVAKAWGVTEAQLATTAFADGTKGDQVRDITQAVDAVISSKDGNVFGFTGVYLEGERAFIRSQETNLGSLSADTGIYALQKILGDAADGQFIVGLRNGGGVRAQIGSVDDDGNKVAPIANTDANKPTGGVSQLDVENALRFDNKLMAFDTTAAGLKSILEHGVAAGANQGRFGQVGGLRFSYDPDNAAGSKVTSVSLVDKNGVVIAKLVENGTVLADAPATITVSTTAFTANGGDGYPIKANGSNFRFLLTDGTLGLPVDEALDFTVAANVPANAMGEQAGFQAYMAAKHGSAATAFDMADTSEALDIRIENLNVRSDGVFGASGTATDGNDTVAGTLAADTLSGGAGNDRISGGAGADLIDLGLGADILRDKLADLHGDKIAGYGLADTLDIDGSLVGRSSLGVTKTAGGATLNAGSSTFEMSGDFTGGDFMAVARGTGVDAHTVVTFENFLPTLREGARVNPAAINGVANESFLVGDGAVRFSVEMKSAVSAHSNTLGTYKVAADGTISDVRIVFSNTLATSAGTTVDLGTAASNQKVGFFLIQDGFDVYGSLPNNLSFVVPGTSTAADIDTGLPPALLSATRGELTSAPIFHSFSTLNPGDANQVLSGTSAGGRELLMGFEDLPSATGDNDFQDVVFSIKVNNDGLFVI
ncbi:choice-of-anchor I family protein [Reyranella sp.]|uniref:choice-of-anchor I family protein n=1 Tax=Reyranella sp. TaxID=1929291 RepID=UPI0025EB666A|nr:choice-of-anchor I family protein [Reyranella sp.]